MSLRNLFAFTRLSLARQFMLASGLILLAGMLVIGAWVGHQIRWGVTNRTAAVTALYVDSFIAPHLQSLAHTSRLDASQRETLDALLAGTALGQRIVALKVWSSDGEVLYSTNAELIGRRFPVGPGLAQALAGNVTTHISDLSDPENEFESDLWPRLIETYAPVLLVGSDEVVAVAEFYQTTDELDRAVRRAQLASWLVVGTATLAMYGLLTGLVGRASNTILAQQRELSAQVEQLSAVLAQNEKLHERVRRAAARTTSLNERFLRRLSADLHDGPGQDLSLALLRIGALSESCADCAAAGSPGRSTDKDFNTIGSALESALAELRSIAAGLRLPAIDRLGLGQTAERAVWDYEQKTGRTVALSLVDVPDAAPLPVKITLYRLLQESLANGFRHAGGAPQTVSLACQDGWLNVEVADSGPGFDPAAVRPTRRLGLAGMRERVEVLGGLFAVESEPGQGTTVRVRLPVDTLEIDDE
jgi:signal transduction histidine kinase